MKEILSTKELEGKKLEEVIELIKKYYGDDLGNVSDSIVQYIVYKYNLPNITTFKKILSYDGEFSKSTIINSSINNRTIKDVINDYRIGFGLILFSIPISILSSLAYFFLEKNLIIFIAILILGPLLTLIGLVRLWSASQIDN